MPIKEQDDMPVSKMQRAGKFVSTGAKIGRNYLKHYGKSLITGDHSKEALHQNNAVDIYDSLSKLKGSALKVAQMLSMDKSILPTAYQQQFSMAQYSAPPLSYPLVVRTFEKYFKKKPTEIFDTFGTSAKNAASMGQVHEATLNGKKLAVKIQYPGVGDSIKSDLAMVKPIALSMFKLNPADYEEFIGEVEGRLMEEVDYVLELQRSVELSGLSNHIPHLIFPTYYPELSSEKILTMDWIEGMPLGDFLKQNTLTSEEANQLGQAMWDFYHFQMHELKTIHADPHPGNFIITPEKKLGIIDFGCVKVIPKDFHATYFQLLDRDILTNEEKLKAVFKDLRFIYDDDSAADKAIFKTIFTELIALLGRPFQKNTFDFSNPDYFTELAVLGTKISAMPEFRNSKRARGVKDALYINRTYFGLYQLLHELKATVSTRIRI